MEKLLIAAVADADVTVRQSIFSSLHGNKGFDDFLAQADSLSAIFAALNDEVCMRPLEILHCDKNLWFMQYGYGSLVFICKVLCW